MRFTDRLRSMTFVGMTMSLMLAGMTAPADDFPTPPNTEKSTETPMDPAEVCRTAKPAKAGGGALEAGVEETVL